MPDGPQYDTSQLDEVQHPTLGALKFPHDMPPDERNASIEKMLQAKSAQTTPKEPEQTWGQKALGAAKDFGEGALKGVGSTAYGLGTTALKAILPEQSPDRMGATPATTERPDILKPQGTAQKLGFAGEQGAEFLIPGGAEEKAGELAGEALPQLGKWAPRLARMGAAALSSGAINKVHGDSFKEGAETGGALGAVGEAGRAIAPALAETALGVTKKMRGFAKTPGEAAIEEIKGIRPETIATNARTEINRMTKEVEKLAAQSTTPTATDPAIKLIDSEMAKAQSRNSKGLYDRLQDVRNRLTHDVFTQQPHAPITLGRVGADLPASKMLELKRGIGDLEEGWNPETRGKMKGIVRKIYSAMDKEVDRAVPGTAELNQKISSLIPVSQRAESVTRGASTTQKVAHRMAAHTGAGLGAVAGGVYGGREGGVPGAIAGATAGAVLPEVLTSPSSMMLAARAARSGVPTRLGRGAILAAKKQLEDSE